MPHFSSLLIGWYLENGRALPWRETKDPYHILLSEIILQQTQVCQGLAYYQRFLNKYPTVNHLASASQDDIMQLWQGLGYYSRARNLHQAAKQIAQLGHFPRTYNEILKLKGVGAYTASAIASFAFNLPHAAIDGNAYRVLSRCFAINTPIDSTTGKKEFEQLANEIIDPKRPALFNQAMMDLGATCCTPKAPQCQQCPINALCLAHAQNEVALYPVKQAKIKLQTRYLTFIAIHDDTHILLKRRSEGDIWQGLYQPLLIEQTQANTTASVNEILTHKNIQPYFNSNTRPTLGTLFTNHKHRLTHRLLIIDAYTLKVDQLCPTNEQYIPIPLQDIDQYGVPKIVQIIFEKLKQTQKL